jgi:hypothetical protein
MNESRNIDSDSNHAKVVLSQFHVSDESRWAILQSLLVATGLMRIFDRKSLLLCPDPSDVRRTRRTTRTVNPNAVHVQVMPLVHLVVHALDALGHPAKPLVDLILLDLGDFLPVTAWPLLASFPGDGNLTRKQSLSAGTGILIRLDGKRSNRCSKLRIRSGSSLTECQYEGKRTNL